MIRNIAFAAIAVATALSTPASAQRAQSPIGLVEAPAVVKHRLVLVSAFSCPYCRAFDVQGMEELRSTWLRKGLSIEYVPFPIHPTDLVSNIALTCGPAAGMPRRRTILFRSQSSIAGSWNAAPEAAKTAVLSMAKGSGAPEMAQLSGIYGSAGALGLTVPQLRQCMTDPARQQQTGQWLRAAVARWNVEGTPTVILDGQRISSSWPSVRAALTRAFSR